MEGLSDALDFLLITGEVPDARIPTMSIDNASQAIGSTASTVALEIGTLPFAASKAGAPARTVNHVPWTTGSGRLAPHGFVDYTDFKNFGFEIRSSLDELGYGNIEPILQGSAVTGRSFKTQRPFDLGRQSDFDIALAGDSLFNAAKNAGISLRSGKTRTRPLNERSLRKLGLFDLSQNLSSRAGRPVNFIIFQTPTGATRKAPSAIFPRINE